MKISLSEQQSRVFACNQRFRVVVGGRRSGKTYLALTELCRAGWGPGRIAWYVAPPIVRRSGLPGIRSRP